MSQSDPIWQAIREEASAASRREPMLTSFLHATVLGHRTLEDALSYRLASMLGDPAIQAMTLREVIDEAFAADPEIGRAMRADIEAVRRRDPACLEYCQPLLYLKGFHALQAQRSAWTSIRRRALARGS
jgi:serine O-acetyltransferase